MAKFFKIISILAFILSCPTLGFSQSGESITVTTYYPSPYGVYNELRLFPHANPVAACNAANSGTMYIDSDDGLLYICNGAIGTWQIASSLWTLAGTSLYPNDNTWNVGIGTNSPGARLQIDTATIGNGEVRINASGTESGVGYYTSGDDWVASVGGWGNNSDFTIGPITTSPGAKMLIQTDGRVGIGTTAPQTRLHVSGGETRLDSGVGIGLTPGNTLQLWLSGCAPCSYGLGSSSLFRCNITPMGVPATYLTSDNAKIVLGDNNNVGIATENPGTRLQVYTDSTANGNTQAISVNRSSTNVEGSLRWFTNGASRWYLQQDNDGTENLKLYSNGVGFVETWNYGTGQVGIGVSPTTGRLHVAGNANIGIYATGPTAAVYASGGQTGIAANGPWEGVYGVGQDRGGSFIGTVNWGVFGYGPGLGLYGLSDTTGVQGSGNVYDFYAAGAGTDYGTASSIRWKKNIKDIDKALDKVLKLRGVYFDWDKEHGGQHDMGMIAEEVGKIIPEVVSYEKNSIYATGIDYGALTPILVEAIKEQQKEIESLKSEVALLQKNISKSE